jgi:hypothetical protein
MVQTRISTSSSHDNYTLLYLPSKNRRSGRKHPLAVRDAPYWYAACPLDRLHDGRNAGASAALAIRRWLWNRIRSPRGARQMPGG